jgi:predicted TIM-barrel enzyme
MPTTVGAFDRTYNGSGGAGTNYPGDGFVARIAANGASLLASTFVGGSDGEGLEGVALDSAGNIYISGATYSNNFPTSAGAFQTANRGSSDLFVSKLSGNLQQLLYSSFAGGNGTDYGRAIFATSGGIYLVGMSNSTNFPLMGAIQGSFRGVNDGVLTKFSQP